ncbi:MAG: glycine--tRNA ligase subunit beta, partial [Pseudomonadota bacterium]
MSDLIFSIECQEIPPKQQEPALKKLTHAMSSSLAEHALEGNLIEQFVTPRRMTLIYEDVPKKQKDQTFEIRGPKIDAPEQAIAGFLKANQIKDLSQCKQITTQKGSWWFFERNQKGRLCKDLLPSMIEKLLNNFIWSQSMRQESSDFYWIRPIDHIILLYDSKPIQKTIYLGNHSKKEFKLNHIANGHRVLGQSFKIHNRSQYISDLKQNYVIAHTSDRLQIIQNRLHDIAESNHVQLIEDKALLEEVAGLVEWPIVMSAKIDRHFTNLPAPILHMTLRENQKYFMFQDLNGQLSPIFALVANQEELDPKNP